MTLHWWMHWFWVTSLLMLLESSGRALAAPQSEELQHITTDVETDLRRQMDRQGRAMYYTKTPSLTTAKTPALNTSTNQTDKELDTANVTTDNSTVEIVHPSIKWIPTNASDLTFNDTATPSNVTVTNATVVSSNATEEQNATFTSKKRNLTRLDFVKDDTSLEGASESRIVTEKPLSLETAFVQTRIPPNVESSRRIKDPGEGDMDMGAIAGISFAALVLAALAGSTAFVLYRRRYLNKPQTLNDKCSNPDSSGYLDDSTIRDNSEEMYSLDNDSFLNSLEAMTIQNYWTDTVKHTKL